MVRIMNTKNLIEKQLAEMSKHKWIESEKAGYDLGEEAMLDWVENYSQKGQQKSKKKSKRSESVH
jgi:hypothetical protein